MATTGDRSEVAYIEPVNLAEKFAKFDETWSPKIVGEVNDAALKVVKLEGAFVWHQHSLSTIGSLNFFSPHFPRD